MNQLNNMDLIDENEIRAALKPLRPDVAAFSSGVHRRLEMAANRLNEAQLPWMIDNSKSEQSDWLRIAASFAPIHLLSRNVESNIAPISFAAVSLGKKLVIVLAFPFLCFFMVGLTAIGILKIRAAQKGQIPSDIDTEQARRATSQWWIRYGWIAAVIFITTLVAPFLGWTTPLMIALVCSGFAAVSFVRALAKENLVERSLIGGMCVAGLGLLGQLSQTFSSHSAQVLDPNLVTGFLFAGAFMIASFVRPLAWDRPTDKYGLGKWTRVGLIAFLMINVCGLTYLAWALESYIVLIGIAIVVTAIAFVFANRRFRPSITRLPIVGGLLISGLIMAVSTQSYWRGVTASSIRTYVESFDGSQLGLWDDWTDAAKWLDETGERFDKQLVAQHFQQELDGNPQTHDWMLTAAVRSSLLSGAEMGSYSDIPADRKRLVDQQYIEQPIENLKGDYYRIAAIAVDQELSAADKDVLTHRLMVNWNQLASSDFDYDRLKSALLVTELINRLDGNVQLKQRTSDVHRWLLSNQITEPSPFRSGGGFYITQQAPDSDRRATLAAISLMETYGVPPALDLMQLRSYLRPNFLYDITAFDYVPKMIAREKLNHLSDARPLTAMGYLGTDLPLWLSILLVLLLGYATLSSPVRPSQAIANNSP